MYCGSHLVPMLLNCIVLPPIDIGGGRHHRGFKPCIATGLVAPPPSTDLHSTIQRAS